MFKKMNIANIKQAIASKVSSNVVPSKTSQQHKGSKAEGLAQAFLTHQGLQFVTKNYYCRRGEIDLIFKDNSTIVFIEVRFRQQIRFGSACETINSTKQKKLVNTAEHYLHTHQLTESIASRFDVIGITPNTSDISNFVSKTQNASVVISDKYNNVYRIEWIKDAFQRF